MVYLDDIIVFSQTVEEHFTRLADVLRRLNEAGLKLKPSKCQLFRKSVQYLGYVVSEKGIEIDPLKTSCVKNWPVPKNHETLHQFLGFASYYRKFIQNFAEIAAPLHALTEKTKSWQWTEQCEEAFTSLKGKLLLLPFCPFHSLTKHLSWILMPARRVSVPSCMAHEGHEQVIAYASRVLSKAEKQYCATRREILALVWAVKCFRPYLWGRRFIIRTDHNSLRWLQNFKDPQGQIARWLEILAEYDFTIQHRPGLKHSNADALSRLLCKQCGRQDSEAIAAPSEIKKKAMTSLTVLRRGISSDEYSWVPVLPFIDQKREQQSDPDLMQVTTWIVNGNVPSKLPSYGSYWVQTLWAQSSHLMLQEGVLYRRWEDVPGKGLNKHLQFVLPKALVKTILQECHDSPSGSHLAP